MIVTNPKMQTMEEIEREFDGYCVCIADRETNERDWTLGGKVIVYDKWMTDVWDQSDTIPKEKYPGSWHFSDLTNFDELVSSGIVEVVSLEND